MSLPDAIEAFITARLCETCSHEFTEHGPDGVCDCCRCPRFIDEPDFVSEGTGK